jgi:TIR domain/Domain of unknown function (DUF4062)
VSAGDTVADMSYFSARDDLSIEACRSEIDQANVYVLIAGFHYGLPVRERPEVSYCELEYDMASDAGKPRLVFVLGEDTEGPPALFVDSDHGSRQVAFRERLRRSGAVTAEIASPAQLSESLHRALVNDLADTPGAQPDDEPSPISVFISHSQDHRTVEALSDMLHSIGFSTWSDTNLQPGEDWRSAVQEAIERADILLLVVEPTTSRKQEAEWSTALARAWTGEKTVVPIILHGASPPAGLRRWNTLNVRDVSDLTTDDLLSAVQDRTGIQRSSAAQSELSERLGLVRAVADQLDTTD